MIPIEDFTLPEFLSNKSVNTIHQMMLDQLPDDFDKSEGQHAYNLTRPTALVAAELCQQILPNVVRLIFPKSAYGEWLDFHAQVRGISRREATASAGVLRLTVQPGTMIPVGAEFATASIDGQPSVVFTATESRYAENDTVELPVRCTQTGTR